MVQWTRSLPPSLLGRLSKHTHTCTHTHTHAHTHTHIHTHMQTHTHAHTHRMVRIMEVIVNQTSSQRDWKHSVRSVLKLGVKHFQVNNKHSGNSQQPTHQQHSGAGVNTTDVRRHLYDKQDPTLGAKGPSSRKTDLDSYNHAPHQTSPSPTDQDESVFDSQQDQLREEQGSRHSLSPSHGTTMDHLDSQNLSYDKKSHTLEMLAG